MENIWKCGEAEKVDMPDGMESSLNNETSGICFCHYQDPNLMQRLVMPGLDSKIYYKTDQGEWWVDSDKWPHLDIPGIVQAAAP